MDRSEICSRLKSFSHVRLWDSLDCSLPGSSVRWISQARVLEWVAISFSRRSSRPRDWTWVSRIVGRCFTIWATVEVKDQPSKLLIVLSSVTFAPYLKTSLRSQVHYFHKYFPLSITILLGVLEAWMNQHGFSEHLSWKEVSPMQVTCWETESMGSTKINVRACSLGGLVWLLLFFYKKLLQVHSKWSNAH